MGKTPKIFMESSQEATMRRRSNDTCTPEGQDSGIAPRPRCSDFMLHRSPKTYLSYKSGSPEETLRTIQDVLRPYFFPDIVVSLQPNEFGSTWFCRVSLVHGSVGQNGKGMTIPLALASGFAEFMERLQALYLWRNYSPALPHLEMTPDVIPENERTQWNTFNAALAREMHDRIVPQPSLDGMYEFHDLMNGTVVYLARSLVYTPFLTTGTAAGNTREEALVQALCELFERYAARTVLRNRMVVPSIPWNFLSPSVREMLHQIQEAGFEVYVKDFSLGIGLPVVCVVVGTPEAGYHARPGSAPGINRAVERCILEYYQGIPSTAAKISAVREATDRIKHIMSTLSSHLDVLFSLDEFLTVNFLNAYDFPPDELEFLTKDAPGVAPWDYEREDFYEEIDLLLGLCRKNEIRLYARDLGWMGFPTVQLLSPDLKGHEYDSIERLSLHSQTLMQFQKLLLRGISCVKSPEFSELLHTPEVMYHCLVHNPPLVDRLRGLPQDGSFWVMNSWYFLGLVAYYHQDIDLAKCFFECYRAFNPQDEYSLCLIQAIALLPSEPWNERGLLKEEVAASLRERLHGVSQSTVEEVLMDLQDPKAVLDILDQVVVPCDTCDTCAIASECSYGRVLSVMKKIGDSFPGIFTWESQP